MKTHGTSTGWTVKSYQSIMADHNYRVVCERGGVTREVRMYGPKPPVPGEVITLSRD